LISNLQLALSERDYSSVRIRGKGNKLRHCPLWPHTAQLLKAITDGRASTERVFLNRLRQPMTRFGVHAMVQRYAMRVSKKIPAMAAKRVSPHSIRHYVPFRTMSSDIGQQSRSSGDSCHSADAVSVSPDIVFSFLQAVEEAEQLISGSITGRPAIWRRCLGESLLFHRQRCLQIDLRCLHRLMSEPQCDHGTIDACL
jgi:hypothetical protein